MIQTRDYCIMLVSNTISKNQLNQKLKLMVEVPGYAIYSISREKIVSHILSKSWVNDWHLNHKENIFKIKHTYKQMSSEFVCPQIQAPLQPLFPEHKGKNFN